ncbi:MAG: dihydrolipoyl dehydrogenase [Alphaproteobacteria bacterium]|nr:dihydrolipoyl dehydrogenase [Alphaproteobacteria bacterium]
MTDAVDLVIIGAGPSGYVAAIRARQLGLKTVIVDKRTSLGGTCLNVGCIPSKALLQSSHLYHQAVHKFQDHGIQVTPKFDLSHMLKHKDKIVSDLAKGIDFLMKKNKVRRVMGSATITAVGKVGITDGKNKGEIIATKNILIATGSESTPLLGLVVDEKNIVTSTGALEFPAVPKKLLVIGAGVIGLELGSVWARLGAEVTVVEFLDHITPGMDMEISKQFKKILEKQGLKFTMGTKVTSAKVKKIGVEVTMELASGGDVRCQTVDKVLLCIGRSPYTDGLGLEGVGVQTNQRSMIEVDGRYQTSVPGIYAIGDCIPGPMLAHKAEDEGTACVEMLTGHSRHINYNAIPEVIYTDPEVANVGATEEQLKEQGRKYRVGKFPFSANSRARAVGAGDGFVKILADDETDQILGGHIIGSDAGTLIHEISLLMEFTASSEDLARCTHAHPTLNEAVKEAALAASGLGTMHI